MDRGRIRLLTFCIISLFVCLLMRVLYLQTYSAENLSQAASSQRVIDTKIEGLRGEILDRNDIRFTDRKKKSYVVLKPLLLRGDADSLRKISETLGENFYKLKKDIEIKSDPILLDLGKEKTNSILNIKSSGFSIINTLDRYDSSSIARHVVGYINSSDQTGGSGIEKFYDKYLTSSSQSYVGVIIDAKKNPLQGLGYRLITENENKKKQNVKLTLDYHIQKIVEDVLKKDNITGAVVVEDVSNGDILAMASYPDFAQNDIKSYLGSTGNELFNRAVASYNLGSVFKIIVAAEAIESQEFIDSNYLCTGSIRVGNKIFRCSSINGHGVVNFDKAFASSCNAFFIKLGIQLGYKNIIRMADRFGMGKVTGIIEQGIDESAGNLPGINRNVTDGTIANISIGQGEILATPLQVADLVATVANGGIKNKINIVDSIIDIDGSKVKKIRRDNGVRILSRDTCKRLKQLMEEVTSQGTGKEANLDKYGGSAGKTGSAETGNPNVVHAWFAGYFPRIDPKFSIAVFVENGKKGGLVAGPIFAKIAERIARLGY
jgi:penicillin-binding protein 2